VDTNVLEVLAASKENITAVDDIQRVSNEMTEPLGKPVHAVSGSRYASTTFTPSGEIRAVRN
jgi:hypothetical protein